MFSEKKFFKIYPFVFWIFLLLSLIFNYWSSFNNFFFGDDFFNLMLSKTDNLKGVIGFFNPVTAPHNFPFYRPLTTQFYFWLSEKLFNLNPVGYHMINFSFFVITLFLINYLTKLLFRDKVLVYLTTFFYAFSASHFYRLYFLSQFQELGLAVCYFSAVILFILFIKRKQFLFYLLSMLSFMLAIVCKETAITLPLVIILADFCFIKKETFFLWFKNRIKYYLAYWSILFLYLYLRLAYFGFSSGKEYQFIFGLKSIVNNILWYFLWSLGVPESFVNVRLVDKHYLINPQLLTNFGYSGALVLPLLLIFVFFILLGIKFLVEQMWVQKNAKDITFFLFAGLWFLLTLAMVMFFPFHKFSYSLTLPLFGTSILMALIIRKIINFSHIFFTLSVLIYLLLNQASMLYITQTHWAVERAQIAKKVFAYLQNNYLFLPDNAEIYFSDSDMCYYPNVDERFVSKWHSQELDYVLVGSNGIDVFYNYNKNIKKAGKNIQVFFEHETPLETINANKANLILTKQFFIN